MKKDKIFDAVKMMREIRDQMSEEIKGMTPKEQIEYIEKKSGFRRFQREKREKNKTKSYILHNRNF
jgi:hypothetical protein